jgi:hypothetical protein
MGEEPKEDVRWKRRADGAGVGVHISCPIAPSESSLNGYLKTFSRCPVLPRRATYLEIGLEHNES